MQRWERRAQKWMIRAAERRVRRRARYRDKAHCGRVEEPSAQREQVETVALDNENERAEIAA
jgi:hypothetical protein